MADGSKITSMIVLVIVGIIIMIFGGLVIWKYWQDQKIIQAGIANNTISPAVASALPSPGWTYGLAAVQIILGLILVIWGIIQYFAGSKYMEHIKDYGSRLLASQPAVVTDHAVPGVTEVKTTYVPTVGSRRAIKV